MLVATKKESSRPQLVKCKGCKVKFVPKDRRQHFHSPVCREAYYKRVYFSGVKADKVCPNCGKEFTTSMPHKQVYCGAECRGEAFGKRKDVVVASLGTQEKTFLEQRFSVLKDSSFHCAFCGRGPEDGAKLTTVPGSTGELVAACGECAEGRALSGAKQQFAAH